MLPGEAGAPPPGPARRCGRRSTAPFIERRRASFSISGNGTGFECRLGKAFEPCTSPKLDKRLKRRRYVFRVRSVATGAADPTPAKRRFRVQWA